MTHMTVAIDADGKVQWYDDGELYFWMGYASRKVDALKREFAWQDAERVAKLSASMCVPALAACLRTAWGN